MSTTTRHIKGFHNPTIKRVLKHYTNIQYLSKQYSRPTRQLKLIRSSRSLRLAQGLYNLIDHSGSFCQIFTELIARTISLGSVSKSVQTSRWPVGLHQPEYVAHVLSGDGGNVPLEGPRHFTKSPHQRERLISIPFWDIHGLGYLQGSIPDSSQLHELPLHRVSGL